MLSIQGCHKLFICTHPLYWPYRMATLRASLSKASFTLQFIPREWKKKKKNQLSGQEILLLSRQRGETTQNSTISQQSQALVCCNWRTVMNPAKKGSRCSHRQSLIQIDLWSGQWLVFINHLSYTHSPWQSRRHIGKWAWNWWHRWGQTSGSLESSWVFQ